MVLPKKHLSIYESCFGFGAYLLTQMHKPLTIDALWDNYKSTYANKNYPVKFSFDQFVLAIDYLYIIGAIKINERGLLCYEIT